MAIYFVSSADGSDGDSGVTLDLAWATLSFALASGGLSAGDSVAIRRTHAETPTSDITLAYTGTSLLPILVFGCPRAAHAISQAGWTNGSTTVDLIDPASMTRLAHQARYITAPDGEVYFVTRVVDSNTIIIDREYAGPTLVPLLGACSINADDTQDDWDNYNDAADTIKKAGWESDADDLPVIDFNDGNFQVNTFLGRHHTFKHIEFKDSTDNLGIFRIYTTHGIQIEGCLFKQTVENDPIIYTTTAVPFIKRCTIEGSGTGTSQRGLVGSFTLKDVAIYNMGDFGARLSWVFMENVNIGVEIANGDDDLVMIDGLSVYGRDIKLGGTNGTVFFDAGGSTLNKYGSPIGKVSIENYNKILGTNRTFYTGGYYEKAAISGETPNKKVSDNVIKIVPNIAGYEYRPNIAVPIMVHELEMTAAAHTLKYWIYNDSGVTLNDGDAKANIWLKAEYINSYDDTTEYTITEIFSAEHTIADAADADDWDSLSVTLTPAVAGKVRLTIYLSIYSAAGTLFVDPAVVIT